MSSTNPGSALSRTRSLRQPSSRTQTTTSGTSDPSRITAQQGTATGPGDHHNSPDKKRNYQRSQESPPLGSVQPHHPGLGPAGGFRRSGIAIPEPPTCPSTINPPAGGFVPTGHIRRGLTVNSEANYLLRRSHISTPGRLRRKCRTGSHRHRPIHPACPRQVFRDDPLRASTVADIYY
ncbi:hypothetical protein N0V88_002082 [Collariella sp. IMI 366227]|nr:hypothetical protein N0V88_002082 [Collariella sp. IMI 366227]